MAIDPHPPTGVGADAPPARPRSRSQAKVPNYGAGRTCSDAECATALSRYNDGTLCWHHSQPADRRRPT